MTDTIEQAVMACVNPMTPQEVRVEAHKVCEQAKASPAAHQTAVEMFCKSSTPDVRFWCLSTLEEVIKHRYQSLTPESRVYMRQFFLQYIGQETTNSRHDAKFIVNKVSQLVALIFGQDFPEEWPNAFLELLQVANTSQASADMFLRVLFAIDDNIIDQSHHRSQMDAAVASKVKDGLRENGMTEVVHACASIIVAFRSSDLSLTKLALLVLSKYAHWMDINLFIHEQVFGLVLSCLSEPSLACDAAATLAEIVCKKMPGQAKLELLERINVHGIVTSIGSSFASSGDSRIVQSSSSFILAYVKEILVLWSKKEDIRPEHVASIQQHVISSISMLLHVLSVVKDSDANKDVAVETLQLYLATVRKLPQQELPNHMTNMEKILQTVAVRCQLPQGFELDGPAEIIDSVANFRRQLAIILRNVSRIFPDNTKQFIKVNLASVIQAEVGKTCEDSCIRVEAAVQMMFELGEAIPGEGSKVEGVFFEMMTMVLRAELWKLPFTPLQRTLAETLVRYYNFYLLDQQFLGTTIQFFLDNRGVNSPSRALSNRAAYLFLRFMKSIKGAGSPFAQSLAVSFKAIIEPYCSHAPSWAASHSEIIMVAEAVGFTLSLAEVESSVRGLCVTECIGPLTQSMEALSAAGIQGQGIEGDVRVDRIGMCFEVIAHFCKGLGKSVPEMWSLFERPCFLAFSAINTCPMQLEARARTFLHCLIDTAGNIVFQAVQQSLAALISCGEIRVVISSMELLQQTVARFKGDSAQLLVALLGRILPVLQQVAPMSSIPQSSVDSSFSEEVREVREVWRHLCVTTVALFTHACPQVLQNPALSAGVQPLLEAMMSILTTNSSINLLRPIVQVASMLVSGWTPECAIGADYLQQRVGPCLLSCALLPQLDTQDALTHLTLVTISSTLVGMLKKTGDSFLFFVQNFLQSKGISSTLAESFAASIKVASGKDLMPALRAIREQAVPQISSP